MKIGVDLDDVIAQCAVPYVRAFAKQYGLQLPDEDIGWHTLGEIAAVPQEEKDRFRARLYDSPFFSQLEPYADCPATLKRLVAAGHELYFVTARAERRRVVTETWLREKGLLDYAKAVHLKPQGDFDPTLPRGRYDPRGSAAYKVRLADDLGLELFCEDDRAISLALAETGLRVLLFDQPWNRDVEHALIQRVCGWAEVGDMFGVR